MVRIVSQTDHVDHAGRHQNVGRLELSLADAGDGVRREDPHVGMMVPGTDVIVSAIRTAFAGAMPQSMG